MSNLAVNETAIFRFGRRNSLRDLHKYFPLPVRFLQSVTVVDELPVKRLQFVPLESIAEPDTGRSDLFDRETMVFASDCAAGDEQQDRQHAD